MGVESSVGAWVERRFARGFCKETGGFELRTARENGACACVARWFCAGNSERIKRKVRGQRGLGRGESCAHLQGNVHELRSLGTLVAIFGNGMTRFWDVCARVCVGFRRGTEQGSIANRAVRGGWGAGCGRVCDGQRAVACWLSNAGARLARGSEGGRLGLGEPVDQDWGSNGTGRGSLSRSPTCL